jgi:hypothetical protein
MNANNTGIGSQAWSRVHGGTGRFGISRDAEGHYHVIDHASDTIDDEPMNRIAALRIAFDREVDWLKVAKAEGVAV